MSQPWVSKYDPEPIQPNKPHKTKVLHCNTIEEPDVHNTSELEFKFDDPVRNVWGFKDHSWRRLILRVEQPRYDFYHGSTPAFVIENLIRLYKPKRVLDSMARG